MADCGCELEAKGQEERRTLRQLLVVNGIMFVIELGIGLFAGSIALVADSLDMLADAVVYGIGLSAVGNSKSNKVRAAFISGFFQIALAGLVLGDVIRRFFVGSEPEPGWMVSIGFLALLANLYCLALIAKHRRGEVHMRASWIFSRNDVIANLGVILAGFLVSVFQSRLPDLMIGVAIALLVLHGGIDIICDARRERAD
ncbi:cation transporter [Egbenema bharatensis]|uniref:cation transporter n=1 Tax=Egbenema bharatensis TaxID=3463334 RepID=UPI003A843E5F